MTIDGQWSYAGLFGLVSYSGAERTSARLANINLENVQIHMEVPTSLNVNVAGLAGQSPAAISATAMSCPAQSSATAG